MPDLVSRAAARLETLAWLYAFTFFMAAFALPLLIAAERTILFSSTLNGAPGVLSIAVAVAVALAIRVGRLTPPAVTGTEVTDTSAATTAERGVGPDISDAARQRFEREAQVIAQLRSPHTVTLFDFGVAQEGSWYYAMELLDGIDADAFVRRFGPMPAERVVYILRQICHSLSEAESHGLVHCDIKPANIFLCRYGEDHDYYSARRDSRHAGLHRAGAGTGRVRRGHPR